MVRVLSTRHRQAPKQQASKYYSAQIGLNRTLLILVVLLKIGGFR